MKRILSMLLTILLLSLSLVSCQIGGGDDSAPAVTQHVHIFEKATCQSPKTCECGATEGKVSNTHNFKDGLCVDCEKRLVVELARLVTDPGTEQPLNGFYISRGEGDRVEYISVRADITDKSLTQQGIYARVAIKIDQEAIATGMYEWAIERSVYITAADAYERHYIYGVLDASNFLDVGALEVTKIEGFDESEISKYMLYIPTCVDRMVNQNLIPALKNNPSQITVADIGFVNYGESTTTVG